MKRHKAPGLSGLVEEMIQATGDVGTQWILDICYGIVNEGCIPEDWKSRGRLHSSMLHGSETCKKRK